MHNVEYIPNVGKFSDLEIFSENSYLIDQENNIYHVVSTECHKYAVKLSTSEAYTISECQRRKLKFLHINNAVVKIEVNKN